MSAWQEISNSVVEKTTKYRQKYWYYLCDYANICTINTFLYDISCPIKFDIIVTAFAVRVRSGVYGKNSTIKVQGVTDALASISNTIQLAGKTSPLYREEVKYQIIIQRMVEVYLCADPPSVPQLAVPITVSQHCFKSLLLSTDALVPTVV